MFQPVVTTVNPRSTHRALFALLILFALDAEARLGPRLEALLTDRLVADFADPERAVFYLLECVVELGQQALLAATKAELERLDVLARGEVHLVGKVICVEHHAFREHLAGTLENDFTLVLQQLLKLLQLLLRECFGCGCGRCAHGDSPQERAASSRNGVVESAV